MARSTDRRRRRVGVLVAGVAAVSAGIAGLQLTPAAAPVARADGLVPYDGCPELLDAYRSVLRDQATAWAGGYLGRDAVASTDAGAARSESSGAADSAVGSGPTGTNLQEQGVDEPDVAKLRDGRVVTLTGNVLRVVSASRQPSVTGSLRVGRADAYGGELLLLDDDRALVVLPGWRQDGPPPADVTGRLSVMPVGVPLTTLVLVSIGDGDPAVVEESTLTGQYVSARLTDGTVRLVTTSRPALPVAYPMRPGPAAEQLAMTANRAVLASLGVDDVLPQVERRDADGRVIASGPAVGCSSVVHPSQASAASTLVVTTLRPSEGLAATDATAVTTDGDLVYAAEDRLYVATSRWGTVAPLAVDDVAGSGVTGSRERWRLRTRSPRSCTPSTRRPRPARRTSAAVGSRGT